jgi:hypothetical protein
MFIVKIIKGELDFGSEWNLHRWNDFCVDNEGKTLRIEKPKSVRSMQQNSFYWVYLELISRETGNDPNDLHEYFKTKMLPRKIVEIHGKHGHYEFEKIKSTTELSKLEMGEYMDKICAVTEVPIPDPKEYLLANGYIPND